MNERTTFFLLRLFTLSKSVSFFEAVRLRMCVWACVGLLLLVYDYVSVSMQVNVYVYVFDCHLCVCFSVSLMWWCVWRRCKRFIQSNARIHMRSRVRVSTLVRNLHSHIRTRTHSKLSTTRKKRHEAAAAAAVVLVVVVAAEAKKTFKTYTAYATLTNALQRLTS